MGGTGWRPGGAPIGGWSNRVAPWVGGVVLCAGVLSACAKAPTNPPIVFQQEKDDNGPDGGDSTPTTAPPEGGTPPPITPSVPIQDATHAFYQAICRHSEQCGELIDKTWIQCVEELRTAFGNALQDIQVSVDAGFLTYDGVAVTQCTAAMLASPCVGNESGNFALAFWDAPAGSACDTYVTPTRNLGETCHSDHGTGRGNNCTTGYCHRDGISCPGTCQEFQSVGEPCDTALLCEPETTYCGTTACLPRRSKDAVCSFDFECQEGLICHPTFDGKCSPPAQRGESCVDLACDTGLVCRAGHCEDPGGIGDACDAAQSTCEWPLRCLDGTCAEPLVTSESCGADAECASYLCEGGKCLDQVQAGHPCEATAQCPFGLGCVATADGSRCEALRKVGEACSLDECEEGLECHWETSTCIAPPKKAGDLCSFGCPSGLYCDSGVCAPQKANGTACSLSWECVDGECLGGLCAAGCP